MSTSLAPLSPTDRIVIVGAGLAGMRVAEGARHAGFAGEIVLIGDEPHEPYDRPPLSKGVLLSEGHEHTIGLAPDGGLTKLGVTLMLGRSAIAIDRAARELVLGDGERVPYARLVLATGSRVRTLAQLPPGMAGVHYLRGLDDALALRAALASASKVAIVGAGVIGLEIAAAAAGEAREVVIVEAQARAMARTASPVVSALFEARHREAGISFRFGATVASAASATDGKVALRLSDGAELNVDLAIVGVGVSPNCQLARACGLAVEREGVIVDQHGRSSDPAIYAAGEVAMYYNLARAAHERQETWAHAAAHGDHVGRSLIAPAGAYDELTSYWTDQYDLNLQVLGAPRGETDIVRGDVEARKFLVFHVSAGQVIGVSALNSARELRAAKKLIGRPADAALLADVSAPLSALA